MIGYLEGRDRNFLRDMIGYLKGHDRMWITFKIAHACVYLKAVFNLRDTIGYLKGHDRKLYKAYIHKAVANFL